MAAVPVGKWNVTVAAAIGAGVGSAYALGRAAFKITETTAQLDPATISAVVLGETFGGALGGAILFAAVAAIRNFTVR